MINRKNKQMILDLFTDYKSISLKFCYFLLLSLLLSCGKNTSKTTPAESEKNTENKTTDTPTITTKTILCFGDSLTAGYGLDDINEAYPAVLQTKIDSLGLAYTVVNSGVSGETTAGGRSRIEWVLNQQVEVFILELGANDGLRGVPLTETRSNLQFIIDAVRKKNPDTKIILAGMQLPPNMGPEYTTEFRTIFPELTEKNKLALIPFLLKDVGGIETLNQADGIHPTAEGHKILANNVWEILETVIR
ncbi:arylesterase [Aquimarina sp. 2201CG5-10]|uniref:arylesterase n=1 Tax=Aquimarina callyspongiae TaxID=3098150 RepID=UPI002AB3BD25|nr:arylesterase [Aquimarina sp. 2201CG5-10]MDY8136000.1 arylesterase [Aquimarina sp. 2201CG5-10]